uniref:Pyrin domain-containing protein n=1 Tax=Mola mola TaxID=94237 RepID=A0A3Q3WV09_MOLML
MPRKTITSAIQFCLENLGLQDYNKFCSGLLDRREGKRVPRSKVEGKDFLEVVRVLVSTFCENGALQVTLEILRDIDCNVDAEQLEAIGQGSKPGSNDSELFTCFINITDEHFVDKYRSQLIASVSSIAPILDELLQQKSPRHHLGKMWIN